MESYFKTTVTVTESGFEVRTEEIDRKTPAETGNPRPAGYIGTGNAVFYYSRTKPEIKKHLPAAKAECLNRLEKHIQQLTEILNANK